MRTQDLQDYCLDLLQSARAWRRLADVIVRPHGLSESTALPLILIARRGGCKQNEIADALGIEAASLVRALDQLCAGGFLRRDPDGADRRVRRLNLTVEGRAMADRLSADLDGLRLAVFAGLDPADIAASRRVFARIAAHTASLPGSADEARP